MSRSRVVVSLLGFALGIAVFAWWLQTYGPSLGLHGQLNWGWLLAGFALMCLAPCVQALRTFAIFERRDLDLARIVFSCHGVNAALPAGGDVVEVGWLSKLTGLPLREVIARGVIRMLFTFSVTIAVVGVVTGFWVMSVLSLLAPLIVLSTSDSWWPVSPSDGGNGGWRRPIMAPVHFGLALLQLCLEACAFICVGWSLSLPMEFELALGLRAMVEWTTYLPVPLSGIGLHHAGITEFSTFINGPEIELASHAMLHHGLFWLSAVVVGLSAWFLVEKKRI